MKTFLPFRGTLPESVSDALKVALEGGTPKAQETNSEAYSAYLQGRYFSDRRSKEDLEMPSKKLDD